MRLLHQEDVEQSFVDRIGTFGHFHCMIVNFAISVCIGKIRITASPFEVRRFSNDQLAHTVNKETLPTCQQANNCMGLEALSHNKFLQIHLFHQARLRL